MRRDGLPQALVHPAPVVATLVACSLLGAVGGLRATGARERRAGQQQPPGEDAGGVRGSHAPGTGGSVLAGSLHGGSGAGPLHDANGTVQRFSSCTQACDKCFDDHYQGCLAFCHVGCEDYCAKKLPRPRCERSQEWVAQVGHVFQALDAKAVMCQFTGPSGCPDPPLLVMPTPIPFEPYNAAKVEQQS
uniref:Uncharacterized protein n=1 Tax=Alexandrium monilatum TaxID=311494 RepID=A0A7S4Q7A0_9DINO|mmetsp:Transcript_16648/g.50207  ORF Transcript_16648/g.50207 Transcript_16648/m.50207 type:complete len:189 (+) Transcript_16648:86-652(+)